MKSVLYIGNKLNEKHKNPAYITILGGLLEQEAYTLFYASSKKNKVLRLVDMLWACLKYFSKVDVVLIDTYSTLNFYYAFFVSQLCRLIGLKYIPILHGGNLPQRLNNNPLLSRWLFKNAYKNVAPSIYLKNSFERLGYTNVLHIPNAIEIKEYPFQVRNFESLNLLWVRSIAKIYNPLLAVNILKAIQDRGISASLCMVGPDSDGSLTEVKALANTLDVEVKFTGKLTKQEWIALSKDYNVFINTTNFDNMPVSVIEAMALGLPVVSTNVGGMPFLIKHQRDGVLVAPNDVDSFTDAILELYKDPDKSIKMITEARKKVEQFDWNVVKKQWLELLE